MRSVMPKHHGRRAARPLATGVMGPPTTKTHRITIPMKVGPSIPFAGFASAIEVRKSRTLKSTGPVSKLKPRQTSAVSSMPRMWPRSP
jgi:hypothetical protein